MLNTKDLDLMAKRKLILAEKSKMILVLIMTILNLI